MIEQYKLYQREYNLTIYDEKKLAKYGLEKAIFCYVGYTKQSLMERSYQWKWDVIHNRNIDKRIVEFIKKLKMFYMNETDYKANVIEHLLFFNASVIDVAINETQARAKEKYYTGHYHSMALFGEILENHYILLSDKDSCYKTINENGCQILKVKKLKKFK